jgi:hypothetical protein
MASTYDLWGAARLPSRLLRFRLLGCDERILAFELGALDGCDQGLSLPFDAANRRPTFERRISLERGFAFLDDDLDGQLHFDLHVARHIFSPQFS